MNSQRPLSKRKTVQLLVILTIMAWATQTMLHQWGFGQEVAPLVVTPDTVDPANQAAPQKFVPGDSSTAPAGTLSLRAEATVAGAEVKLKQVCRWSDADSAIFSSVADLTLIRLSDTDPYRSITVDEIRQTLHQAGVNIAKINFSGAISCTVSRSDLQTDERSALDRWIDSRQPSSPTTQPAAVAIAVEPVPTAAPSTHPEVDDRQVHTLKELLTADICQRLQISSNLIVMSFGPDDEKVLSLSEPYFKFDINPSRVRNLGAVSWDVTISSDGGSKKVSLSARARAWQDQVIVARPLSVKQVLQDNDFTDRRVIVDALPDETLLRRDQCIGQQASRDLKPGMVMIARMVDPIPLVKSGQLVTVTLTQGTVQIKAVARAMEGGCFGETIKVRNETTRDIFEVTITGPQQGRLGGSASAGVASVGN